MRLLLVLVTAVAARRLMAQPPSASSATQTQVTRTASSWATDSAAVAEASHAWARALQHSDMRALDTLLATGFRLSASSDGGVGVDKPTWIRNTQTLLATDSASYRVMGYRAVGPDVVVGSGVLYWRTKLRGWPVPIHSFAVTDVWVRQAGTDSWQVVARDAEMAPPVFLVLGAVAGAALMGVLWALIAWRQRRQRRRLGVTSLRDRPDETGMTAALAPAA